jgi:NAD+ diphosphatase
MTIDTGTKYLPQYNPGTEKENVWALAFSGKKLLLKSTGDGLRIPTAGELPESIGEPAANEYIGSYDGHACVCMQAGPLSTLPPGFETADPMEITALTGDAGLFILAGTAGHILHWERMNRFCGRCGHEMTDKADERARICPACGNIVYPRISPATITAVFRGNEILLAHNRNFKRNLHSLIAGFVEPGETLEECAAREIREEVGIRVKNIRYAGSQPWPFPDSLMTAFTAEYDGGEIRADGAEITQAGWYTPGTLPEIPSSDSIAGKIIRRYQSSWPDPR